MSVSGVLVKWVLDKIDKIFILRSSATAEELTKGLHEDLRQFKDDVQILRAWLENLLGGGNPSEHALHVSLMKSNIKQIDSAKRNLGSDEKKVWRDIQRLRFFLERDNCAHIYHNLYGILVKIRELKRRVSFGANHLLLYTKERKHNLIPVYEKEISQVHRELSESLTPAIEASIADVLNFSRGLK